MLIPITWPQPYGICLVHSKKYVFRVSMHVPFIYKSSQICCFTKYPVIPQSHWSILISAWIVNFVHVFQPEFIKHPFEKMSPLNFSIPISDIYSLVVCHDNFTRITSSVSQYNIVSNVLLNFHSNSFLKKYILLEFYCF